LDTWVVFGALANEAGVSFAASQALLLAMRRSPLLITRSLMVCLQRMGMVEESLVENDIAIRYWVDGSLDGWMSLTYILDFMALLLVLVLYS
jgi:hypothetical protein